MSSLFGLGRPQPSSAEKISAIEAEMKMMTEMHARLAKICKAKCVPTDYREAELNKGESVCLDRCAAKFFSVHMSVSEQMQKEGAARGGSMF
ncbi:protein transporter tim10 [Sporothrix eucalyptigena]|uniref:Mitochondrial import inner membrane translocase subunit n=1 Tax=Sporothrix eucalyptigena TaxID=1812306 RepID=A0ABP0BY83_9PEZI